MPSIPKIFFTQRSLKPISVIGTGSYGTVIKAQKKDGSLVALKFQKVHTVNMMELDLMTKYIHVNNQKMKHPNLIYANDIGFINIDNYDYFVLELPLGEDFNKACQAASNEQKLMYIYDIVSGLCFLQNNGYYHCDVKMENIVLINNKAVIIDFGLLGTESTQVCNTYDYRPPELFKSQQNKSNLMKADSWALGVLIYSIYNNGRLFQTNPLTEENVKKKVFEFEKNPKINFGKVPSELHEIMTGLLKPKASERLSICDIFKKEPFVSKNLKQPTYNFSDEYATYENFTLTQEEINTLEENFFSITQVQNKDLYISIKVLFDYYDLYYKLKPLFDLDENMGYMERAEICLIMAYGSNYDVDNVLKLIPDNDELLELIFSEILPYMVKNRIQLTNKTVFNDAFSKDCVDKLIPMLTKPEFYQASPEERKGIVMKLELEETDDEKMNRQSPEQSIGEFSEIFVKFMMTDDQPDWQMDEDEYY